MRSLVFQLSIAGACLPALELGAVQTAWAAEPSASEISVARRLFEEGKAAEDAGRWAEAVAKFRQAVGIKDTPGIRFHLAHCEEEQGAFVEALLDYDRARELIDGGVRAPDVQKVLATARENARAKVALLTLRLPDGVQNVSVEVDGKALSASVLGVPVPINPGRHRLRAVAVGRTTFSGEVELGTGEVRSVALELPVATTLPPMKEKASVSPAAPPPAAPAAAPTTDSSVSGRSIALVGEASLVAVGLGTGIAFSIAHSSASERYDAENRKVLAQVGGSDPSGTACRPARPHCSELDQARKDREQAATLQATGFIAAGVSALAFGLTWWLWPSQPAAVHVGASRDGFALAVSGRF